MLGLVAGLIAARAGFRKLLLISLILGAVISAFQATLPPLPLMLASRVLEGLSHLGIVVTAPTLIAQLSNDKYRAAAMTFWGTFFGVAFALVAWLAPSAIEEFGLKGLFLFHSALLLIVAIILFFSLPIDRLEDENLTPLTPGFIVQGHFEIYASPFIAAPAIGWLFYTLTYVSLITILPDIVEARHRLFITTAMPLASIFTSLTLGVVLLKRLSAVQVIIIGFTLAFFASLMLLAFPGQPWICVSLFGALGLVQGASFAAVPQLNSKANHRAFANGGLAQMGNIGNGSGTPIALTLLFYGGYQALIITMASAYIVGILCHCHLAKMRKRLALQQ